MAIDPCLSAKGLSEVCKVRSVDRLKIARRTTMVSKRLLKDALRLVKVTIRSTKDFPKGLWLRFPGSRKRSLKGIGRSVNGRWRSLKVS